MKETSILVIYTGGTIGMIKDLDTGALHPFSMDEMFKVLPELERFDCSIDLIAMDPLLDSSNIKPDHWVMMAEIIEKHYELYDGFVLLHGSDTMAYTASALSFIMENLNKPVILTGSQLPLGMIRTDGRDNIITALEIAAAQEDETPIVPEVAIYFENQLMRGNRTFKYNAEDFEAFHSGNYPLLAEAGVYIRYHTNYIRKPNFKKLKIHRNLEQNIAILKLYPGISKSQVGAALKTEGLKGVILESFGSGNAPNEAWFLDELRAAIDCGIIIMNVTQCKSGAVEMGRYETSIELQNMGVISGHDITLESAITKMMYLLGAGRPAEKTKTLLQQSIRGEMSLRN